MADLADFQFMLLPEYITLSGTVTSDTEWVYVNGTITINPGLYPFDRNTPPTASHTGIYYPGQIYFPYARPWFFARLPNPPFGARITYTDDLDAPNAMTELDPTNIGKEREGNFRDSGKLLYDSVRAEYRVIVSGEDQPRAPGNPLEPPLVYDIEWNLGPNGLRRQYDYTSWHQSPDLTIDHDGNPIWTYRAPEDEQPVIWDIGNWPIATISRGNYTFLVLDGRPSPGMVIDLNMQWWNGPGYRCGDAILMSVD